MYIIKTLTISSQYINALLREKMIWYTVKLIMSDGETGYIIGGANSSRELISTVIWDFRTTQYLENY